eukprot:Rhum_TRINITY_DN12366_c3_g1::Rhum_TRINITY_DN12366_c3_g1_i1::g.51410::m.51410
MQQQRLLTLFPHLPPPHKRVISFTPPPRLRPCLLCFCTTAKKKIPSFSPPPHAKGGGRSGHPTLHLMPIFPSPPPAKLPPPPPFLTACFPPSSPILLPRCPVASTLPIPLRMCPLGLHWGGVFGKKNTVDTVSLSLPCVTRNHDSSTNDNSNHTTRKKKKANQNKTKQSKQQQQQRCEANSAQNHPSPPPETHPVAHCPSCSHSLNSHHPPSPSRVTRARGFDKTGTATPVRNQSPLRPPHSPFSPSPPFTPLGSLSDVSACCRRCSTEFISGFEAVSFSGPIFFYSPPFSLLHFFLLSFLFHCFPLFSSP